MRSAHPTSPHRRTESPCLGSLFVHFAKYKCRNPKADWVVISGLVTAISSVVSSLEVHVARHTIHATHHTQPHRLQPLFTLLSPLSSVSFVGYTRSDPFPKGTSESERWINGTARIGYNRATSQPLTPAATLSDRIHEDWKLPPLKLCPRHALCVSDRAVCTMCTNAGEEPWRDSSRRKDEMSTGGHLDP